MSLRGVTSTPRNSCEEIKSGEVTVRDVLLVKKTEVFTQLF